MHNYKFNIGDYLSHTGHLTVTEDIAYRRLIDYQFLNECHIPADIKQAARVIRLPDNLTDVEQVLNEYYTLDENGWTNNRVERELKEYHSKALNASKAGKASAKARKAKKKQQVTSGNGRSTDDEQTCNQTLTINHKPITNNHKDQKKRASPFVPPRYVDVQIYCQERKNNVDPTDFINHHEANGWTRGKNYIKDWKAWERTWEKNNE